MIGIVEDKRAEVAALCVKYGVKRLELFGSGAGDGFDPEASDLDFVVSFERRDPPELFDRYFGLQEDLEAALRPQGGPRYGGRPAQGPGLRREHLGGSGIAL